MKTPARQPPASHFHRSDFDDAMTQLEVETCGFSIYEDLAHMGVSMLIG
jgi:hypothetical protein